MVVNLKNVRNYFIALYLIFSAVVTSVTVNRILLLVTIGVCGLTCLINKEFQFKSNSLFKYLALYGGFLAFSSIYTIAPQDEVLSLLISYFSMLVTLYFIIISIDEEADVRFYIKTIIVTAVVCCIYTLFTIGIDGIMMLGDSDTAFRLAGEEQNANSVGMLAAFGSVFCFYFISFEKPKRMLLYYVILIFTFVFVLLTGSRKSLLMIAMGFVMIVYHKNILTGNAIKFFFRMLVAILAFTLVIYYIMESGKFVIISERVEGLIEGMFGNGNNGDHSTTARMDMILKGFEVFLTSPFKGQGIYASYRYFLTYSHNNYIEIMMNTGLIGLFLFYKPIVSSFMSLLKIDKKIREPIYIIALFVFLWLFVGAWGMVFYFSKIEMSILTIFVCWINMKRDEINGKKNN